MTKLLRLWLFNLIQMLARRKLLKINKMFRLEWFGDFVLFAKPFTQIDQFAAV